MKKNINIYTILILLICPALIMSSCKREVLEETPFSFYASDGVYNSDAGANSSLTGLYTALTDFDYFGATYFSFATQASSSFWGNQAASTDLTALNITPNVFWSYQLFDQSYTVINRANDIIVNLPNSNVSTKVSNNVLGQALWIRAMVYFNLVRIYGGVPLRLKPVTEETLYLPRTPKADVYKQIIEDLNKAKTLLPEPAAQQTGFPHKYAASALLGKVYITMTDGVASSPYWQQAKDELLQVVQNEGTAYTLLPKFSDLWDYTKENSKEAIFEIQFVPTGAANGQLTNLFMPKLIETQPGAVAPAPFARLRVNKEIYDRHIAQYPGDPRLTSTFINNYKQTNGVTKAVYPNNTAAEGFPYLAKYTDPTFITNSSNRNLIYLRYADVLLMLAEAENEINGPANAYQYVNKVLTRARNSVTPAATVPANFTGMTQAEFRTRIMSERFYELLGEFHEYFDIRRRGEAYLLDYLTKHNTYPKLNLAYDFIYPVQGKLMLMPIPAKEMNTNTALTPQDQNPGY